VSEQTLQSVACITSSSSIQLQTQQQRPNTDNQAFSYVAGLHATKNINMIKH